jgi:hypothetical protein
VGGDLLLDLHGGHSERDVKYYPFARQDDRNFGRRNDTLE